jgi:hydrogenase maturation protein HypF
VLGLAWDGVGLGDDGTLWGAEALRLDGPDVVRVASLRPFRLPGGEAAIREPRRAALGLLCSLGLDSEPVARWFSPAERALLEQACAQAINAPQTSSVGRLFDAVAALTGLLGRSRHEAEAALAVEQCARDAPLHVEGYPIQLLGSGPARVETTAMVQALLADLARGADLGHVCARFHATLTQMAVLSAGISDARAVALGGGCFQNARLLDATRAGLEDLGYSVHTARELPPGDGGLSVGQALLAARRLEHGPGGSR